MRKTNVSFVGKGHESFVVPDAVWLGCLRGIKSGFCLCFRFGFDITLVVCIYTYALIKFSMDHGFWLRPFSFANFNVSAVTFPSIFLPSLIGLRSSTLRLGGGG